MTMRDSFSTSVTELQRTWVIWCRLFYPEASTNVPQGPPLPSCMREACEPFFIVAKEAVLDRVVSQLRELLLTGSERTRTARAVFECLPEDLQDRETKEALRIAERTVREDLTPPGLNCLAPSLKRRLIDRSVRMLVDMGDERPPPEVQTQWEALATGLLQRLGES